MLFILFLYNIINMIKYKYLNIKNLKKINNSISIIFIEHKNKIDIKFDNKLNILYVNCNNINYNNQLALTLKKINSLNELYNNFFNTIIIKLNNNTNIQNTIEICEYIYYNFNLYKTTNDINQNYIKNIILTSSIPINNNIKKSMQYGKIISESTNIVKDLINMPGNKLYPKKFANIINKDSKTSGFKCTIYNKNQMIKMKLNTILSVSQGSSYEPQFIILEYNKNNKNNKDKKDKPLLLIGKGVTFDTGGISLKSGDFSDMKTDMTGAAVVYGIIRTISQLNINTNVIGILPIVENMVSKSAVRPGDIITSHSGKTIEIIDTDAEGRLILSDSLSYGIQKFQPKQIIDFATLTSDAEHITDGFTSIIMGNNDNLIDKLIKSGENTNELLTKLPLYDIFIEKTKSDIADIRNYSKDVNAGAIMGGAFLANFTDPKIPWTHIDLSGVWNNKLNEYMTETNSNGKGVRLGINYILNN